MLLTVALMGVAAASVWASTGHSSTSVAGYGGASPQRVRVERGAITPTISFPGVVASVDHGRPVVVANVSPASMYRFAHGVHAVQAQLQGGPGPQACVELQVPGPAGRAARPGAWCAAPCRGVARR